MEFNRSFYKSFNSFQQPFYKDEILLQKVENKLNSFKPLVSIKEIDDLSNRLNSVEKNNSFIIQAGDCAEKFNDFKNIPLLLSIFDELEKIVLKNGFDDVIKIGRVAGQFAKPRSSNFEVIDGIKYNSFRGEIINSICKDKREANPARMILAYNQSKKSIEFIKKITKSFFTSHEALLLPYEANLIRSYLGELYASSAHSLWLGDRTKNLDGAHIYLLSIIKNPVGIKVGKNSNKKDLLKIIKLINPKNILGKVMLIFRLGENIKMLNDFISLIKKNNQNVIFLSDPMHANTKILNGFKIRLIDDILKEANEFFSICKANDVVPRGIHLEIYPDNSINECLKSEDEKIIFKSLCDPRLNKNQTINLFKELNF